MAESNTTTNSNNSGISGSGNIYIFFFIILIFHIIDVMTDFKWGVRIPLYFVAIPLLIWMLGIWKEYNIRQLAFLFLATFAEFYLTKITPNFAVGIAVTFFPISILYFIFTIGGRGWYWLVRVPIIILILFLVMPPLISSLSEQSQIDQMGYKQSTADVFKYMTSKFSSGIGSFWTGTKKLGTETKAGLTSTFKNSTGQQYYQGEVEKNANQKIGVYLENIKEADPFNYENQEILLWATVKARAYEGSANENNDLIIKPSCVADRFDESLKKNGIIKQKQFKVSSYDEQDLDCTFPVIAPLNGKGKPKSLAQGEHTITFNAQFDFTTKAYKKAYFTDYNLLKSLNRENIDIFTQYNLEKNPKAVYTNGPIEIGMETQDVITIGQDTSRSPTIGFSLRNKQTGDLKRINKISLSLPAGLEIATITDPASSTSKLDCNKKFEADSGLTTKDLNVYSLSNEEYKNNNGLELQSFRCTLNIIDKELLMDASPVVTRYIQINANYEYELHGSRTITVKPALQ